MMGGNRVLKPVQPLAKKRKKKISDKPWERKVFSGGRTGGGAVGPTPKNSRVVVTQRETGKKKEMTPPVPTTCKKGDERS